MITVFDGSNGVLFSNEDKIESTKKQGSRTQKSRSKKHINNEIFNKMKDYTSDEFWINKLTAWTNGKYSPCFRYKDGCVIFSKSRIKGKKVYEIMLDEDDVEQSFIKFKEFIVFHTKTISDGDRLHNIELEEMYYNMEKDSRKSFTWNSLHRNDKKRFDAIIDFCSGYETEEPMTKKQFMSLVDAVKLKFLMSNISSPQVFGYEEGSITYVNGIERLPNGYFRCKYTPKETKTSKLTASALSQLEGHSKTGSDFEVDSDVRSTASSIASSCMSFMHESENYTAVWKSYIDSIIK